VAEHTGDFKFHVDSISRFEMGELNQQLFDFAFGKDVVKSEEEFRARVKEDIEATYVRDSDFKFLLDVREYVFKKAGELEFPKDILKRFLLQNLKDESAKQNIDKTLEDYIKELKWSLMRTQLAEGLNVKVDDESVKATAREMVRIQFAQYGINNIPDDTLEQYAGSMLKDEKQQDNIINRSIDRELTKVLKTTVKLAEKVVSIEDFNKMFQDQNA